LIKAALLIATGIGILKLVHGDIVAQADHWIRLLGLDPGRRHIDLALEKLTSIPPKRIRAFGIGTFIYAGLFLTEGIGLWMLKLWAEWFTVIATGSLIPLEAYEIYRRPTPIKIAVLIVNVAVVVFLAWRIKTEQHKR
jgi:uncharacterized membrane protein (DUF2068 family)